MKQHSTSYNRGSVDEENPYWISFSDIMSGLLILFILVSMTLILELIAKREEVDQKIEQIEQIEQALEQILREIKAALQAKNIVVEISENDSVIRIPDRLLTFDSGSFVIPADSARIVHDIGDTIRRVITRQDRYKIFDTIFVEGHTDNQPFRNNYIKGNWGLSAHRAIEVWNYWDRHITGAPGLSALLNHAGEPLFSVSGFGETRPTAGTGSRRFKEARDALLAAARHGEQALYERLRRPIDIRALSDLLGSQGDKARQIQLTPQLVSRLTKPKPQLSTLTLLQLISAWFRYDRFKNSQGLRALGLLLQSQLEQRQNTRRTVMLSLYIEHRALLFAVDAASRLVKRAHASGNFETIIEQYGLTAQADSRLVTLARACYYFARLEALPVDADSPLLKKVTQPEIRDAPLDGEGELIGHAVLRSLISRADASSVSDAWRNTILSITGDPRVPQGHPNYLKWWSRLDLELIHKVRGWLAEFDLKLFLSALEQYGDHTNNEDLQRMYPARKRFLEGLLEQGRVNNTRLFISPDMEQYLTIAFGKKELPAYAIVSGSRSMIYLDVAGVHILEGSHNRAIYGVPQLPKASQIMDFDIRKFRERDLGKGLLEQYVAEFNGQRRDQLEVRHSPKTFNWQHQVIQYLQRHGVNLDIEKLFTPQDYFRYKRIHGLG